MLRLLPIVLIGLILFPMNASRARETKLEQGIRYLKLGNTYRQTRNFAQAEKYFKSGLKLVAPNDYWRAVAYEFGAFIYCDQGKTWQAVEYMAQALQLYQRAIQQDDGSPLPVETILRQMVQQGCPCEYSDVLSTRFTDNLPLQTNANAPGINAPIANERRKLSLYGDGAVANEVVYSLKGQRISSLPNDIPASVTILDLSDNSFKNFPVGLEKFPNLRYLNLSNNRIKELPQNLQTLRNLHALDLSGNKLTELAAGIADLSALSELTLAGNKLKKNMNALCGLHQLKYLDLRNNKLKFDDLKIVLQALNHTEIQHDVYIPAP